MRRGKEGPQAGSLDMLLDTMCNTFGGVCFIALMVAILSAMNPKMGTVETEGTEAARMLADQEKSRLSRMRDELRSALEIQKSFVSSNQTAVAVSATALAQGLSSNATAIARLKAKKAEFEDALATLKTDSDYSKREAARLERLLKDLEERLGAPVGKQRAVRTPTEREISGLTCETIWLRKGKLYLLKNPRQCKCEELPRDAAGKMHWNYTIISGTGYDVDEAFFKSVDWNGIKKDLDSTGFVRVFSDKASFPQLCELRDALIYFRKNYNWHVHEMDVLPFVEGYDGRIQ